MAYRIFHTYRISSTLIFEPGTNHPLQGVIVRLSNFQDVPRRPSCALTPNHNPKRQAGAALQPAKVLFFCRAQFFPIAKPIARERHPLANNLAPKNGKTGLVQSAYKRYYQSASIWSKESSEILDQKRAPKDFQYYI